MAEHWRTDAFELWCWRRLLIFLWTVRRWKQSILKEINPEYSLEEPMLGLKLQYFDHLTWRTDSLKKVLMLGKIEGRRKRVRQKMRWLNGIIDSMDMSLSKPQEIVKDKKDWCAAVHGVTKCWRQLSNWTTVSTYNWKSVTFDYLHLILPSLTKMLRSVVSGTVLVLLVAIQPLKILPLLPQLLLRN